MLTVIFHTILFIFVQLRGLLPPHQVFPQSHTKRPILVVAAFAYKNIHLLFIISFIKIIYLVLSVISYMREKEIALLVF